MPLIFFFVRLVIIEKDVKLSKFGLKKSIPFLKYMIISSCFGTFCKETKFLHCKIMFLNILLRDSYHGKRLNIKIMIINIDLLSCYSYFI